MVKRNMKQVIERTTIPDRYDLTFNELESLIFDNSLEGSKNTVNAILSTFKYGFALGMHYQKKEGRCQE